MPDTRPAQRGDIESYQTRLRDFVASCAQSSAREEPARIRDAAFLVAAKGEGPLCVETLLAEGGGMSSVLHLLGEEQVFMCSRGASGTCLAMVIVQGGREDVCAQGATPALALLGAWAAAWLALSEEERGAGWIEGTTVSVH